MDNLSSIISLEFSEFAAGGGHSSSGLVTRQLIGDASSDSDVPIASEETLSFSEQHLSPPGSQDDPESYGSFGRVFVFPYTITGLISADAIPLGNGGIGDGTSHTSLPLKSVMRSPGCDDGMVLSANDSRSELHSNSVQNSGSSSSSSSVVITAAFAPQTETQAIPLIPVVSEKPYSSKRRKTCGCACT